MSKVINSSQSDFESIVLNSDLPVLVDFWAPWCGPCRAMAPILDELSIRMDGKVKIVKVDVEDRQNQELAMQYEIRSIPSMKLFRGGEVINEFLGLMPGTVLEEHISHSISGETTNA